MHIRRLTRIVAASAASAALAGGFSALALASPAGASGTNGTITPQGAFTPGTPFDSGQQVDVTIPANGIFTPGGTVYILECAAPNGVLPTNISACDGNTAYAGGTLTARVRWLGGRHQRLPARHAVHDLRSTRQPVVA